VTLVLRAGEWSRVTPADAAWRYLTFGVERVGGRVERETGGEEVAIVLLAGSCAVEVDGARFELGPRRGVFDDLPWTVYLPRDSSYSLEGDAEVAVSSAPVERRLEPVLQRPDEVDVEVRGAGNATRQINNMIQSGFPAERLLVVEVLTPAGNWSSYPPHKHDEARPPGEVALEEVYYYRARAPEAFAMQRLYTADGELDETWTVRDGDLVLVPRGYHAFSAAPGYDFYYFNALAGDEHSMAASDDPALAWVRGEFERWEKDPRVPMVTA
jgi:5-deoxy-glucuronate isomerase